ncbi:MAG: glutamine amidotransferase, partial [Acidimicrobiales bacterium]
MTRFRIAVVYPDLLGTYGDVGNALVLANRLRAAGYSAEIDLVGVNESLPEAECYLLGGGEDGPQALAIELLRKD